MGMYNTTTTLTFGFAVSSRHFKSRISFFPIHYKITWLFQTIIYWNWRAPSVVCSLGFVMKYVLFFTYKKCDCSVVFCYCYCYKIAVVNVSLFCCYCCCDANALPSRIKAESKIHQWWDVYYFLVLFYLLMATQQHNFSQHSSKNITLENV